MAFETGTATDHVDLFDKLVAFLTTNADLISAGEEWTQDWTAPMGSVNETATALTGVVSSGDPPKIGMQLVVDAANSQYEIQFVGMTNILSGSSTLTGHANVSPVTRIFADPNPMTYWFTASGRRFVIIVKISSVYSSGYFGLFLPYALPTTYQYPMLVAGAAGLGTGQAADWRSASNAHASMCLPYADDAPPIPATAHVLSPAALWERIIVPDAANSDTLTPAAAVTMHPFFDLLPSFSAGNRATAGVALGYQVEAYGSDYATHPITLVRKSPASQAYGVLDGVVACQGRNNSSENIITLGADDYMVVQDAYRTNVGRYCAVIQG